MHRYIKATITVPNTPAIAASVNNTNQKVIIKSCAPFTNCVSEINNRQVDDAQDVDGVMSMYNLVVSSDAYSKEPESLWQYYRDEPALDNNNNISYFSADNSNSIQFKLKQQITVQTGNGRTKKVETI